MVDAPHNINLKINRVEFVISQQKCISIHCMVERLFNLYRRRFPRQNIVTEVNLFFTMEKSNHCILLFPDNMTTLFLSTKKKFENDTDK